MNENISRIIDDLIEELSNRSTPPTDEELALIEDIEVLSRKRKTEETTDLLLNKLDALTKQIGTKDNQDLKLVLDAIKQIKIEEKEVSIPAPSVTVSPPDLSELTKLLEAHFGQPVKIEFPIKAKDALPVRLSDGKEFYKALGGVSTAIGGLDNRDTFVNALDDSVVDLLYVGRQDRLGAWSIMKLDETGTTTVITYASMRNNDRETYPDYNTAWNKRTELHYTVYSEAF